MSVDLVYGNVTGLRRYVAIPSLRFHTIGVGEILLTITDAQYAAFPNLDASQVYINSVTGRTPSGYQAVMIDQVGNVVSQHHADPACDHPFGAHKLRWNAVAQVGWLFVNEQFIPLPALKRRNFKSPRLLRRSA